MPKKLTNVQAVSQIMNFSYFGALAQLFVIDALTKHADAISALTHEELQSDKWDNGFVSAEAWQGVAREIKAKLDAHLKH